MGGLRLIFLSAMLALSGSSALAQESTTPLPYERLENWVCHPGAPKACAFDLSATEFGLDGSTKRIPFRAATEPKVDCFYVYPTVSHGPSANAPAVVSEDERRAVRQQFARFASVCRLFAPLYRQITVTAMTAGAKGVTLPGTAEAGAIAQGDVDEAWRTYLNKYNEGRGVILIGHSQGAAMLTSLIQRQIDGQPAQQRLIAAVLAGGWVMAPKGKDVGGTFKTIPACRSSQQTGCVITFGTYFQDRPVPLAKVLRFGEREPICTNPAALAGGPAAIHPVLSTNGETIVPELSGEQAPWLTDINAISTPFLTLPGRYLAECRNDANGVWLAISKTKAGESLPEPPGEWLVDGSPEPTMGLHLIDLNLTMNDLIAVAGAQIAAFEDARR